MSISTLYHIVMTNYIIIMFFDVIIMTFQILLIFLFDNYDFFLKIDLGQLVRLTMSTLYFIVMHIILITIISTSQF